MRAHDDPIVVRAQDVVPRDARGVVPEVGQQARRPRAVHVGRAEAESGPETAASDHQVAKFDGGVVADGRRARLDGHDIKDDAEAVAGLVLDRQADELALPPVVIRPSSSRPGCARRCRGGWPVRRRTWACFPARGPP
jgi:hypothetical protein